MAMDAETKNLIRTILFIVTIAALMMQNLRGESLTLYACRSPEYDSDSGFYDDMRLADYRQYCRYVDVTTRAKNLDSNFITVRQ